MHSIVGMKCMAFYLLLAPGLLLPGAAASGVAEVGGRKLLATNVASYRSLGDDSLDPCEHLQKTQCLANDECEYEKSVDKRFKHGNRGSGTGCTTKSARRRATNQEDGTPTRSEINRRMSALDCGELFSASDCNNARQHFGKDCVWNTCWTAKSDQCVSRSDKETCPPLPVERKAQSDSKLSRQNYDSDCDDGKGGTLSYQECNVLGEYCKAGKETTGSNYIKNIKMPLITKGIAGSTDLLAAQLELSCYAHGDNDDKNDDTYIMGSPPAAYTVCVHNVEKDNYEIGQLASGYGGKDCSEYAEVLMDNLDITKDGNPKWTLAVQSQTPVVSQGYDTPIGDDFENIWNYDPNLCVKRTDNVVEYPDGTKAHWTDGQMMDYCDNVAGWIDFVCPGPSSLCANKGLCGSVTDADCQGWATEDDAWTKTTTALCPEYCGENGSCPTNGADFYCQAKTPACAADVCTKDDNCCEDVGFDKNGWMFSGDMGYGVGVAGPKPESLGGFIPSNIRKMP